MPAGPRSPAMAVVNARPAHEWTEKDIAQAPYDLRRAEGPAYTGHILMVFRMLCAQAAFPGQPRGGLAWVMPAAGSETGIQGL
jgi:hypothetical protein